MLPRSWMWAHSKAVHCGTEVRATAGLQSGCASLLFTRCVQAATRDAFTEALAGYQPAITPRLDEFLLDMREGSFRCSLCGRRFKTANQRLFHARSHGVAIPPKSSSRRGGASSSAHSVAAPDGSGPSDAPSAPSGSRFHCPILTCSYGSGGKTLRNKRCLQRHYQRAHGSAELSCPRRGCSLRFSLRSDLATHVKHCGRRHFVCSCGMELASKRSLTRHQQRTSHQGVAAQPGDAKRCEDGSAPPRPAKRQRIRPRSPPASVATMASVGVNSSPLPDVVGSEASGSHANRAPCLTSPMRLLLMSPRGDRDRRTLTYARLRQPLPPSVMVDAATDAMPTVPCDSSRAGDTLQAKHGDGRGDCSDAGEDGSVNAPVAFAHVGTEPMEAMGFAAQTADRGTSPTDFDGLWPYLSYLGTDDGSLLAPAAFTGMSGLAVAAQGSGSTPQAAAAAAPAVTADAVVVLMHSTGTSMDE